MDARRRAAIAILVAGAGTAVRAAGRVEHGYVAGAEFVCEEAVYLIEVIRFDSSVVIQIRNAGRGRPQRETFPIQGEGVAVWPHIRHQDVVILDGESEIRGAAGIGRAVERRFFRLRHDKGQGRHHIRGSLHMDGVEFAQSILGHLSPPHLPADPCLLRWLFR